jgi:hypothetical protein
MSVVAALLLAVMVGVLAYNAGLERGVAQGVAQSGKVVAAPGAVPYPYPYYGGWYRPWGFGSVFGPFIFFLFVAMMVRGVFGRASWHRGRCGSSSLDEWHRQAHERFGDHPTGGNPSGGAAAR